MLWPMGKLGWKMQECFSARLTAQSNARTGDAEGNLLIDGSDSRFYVAEVEIPAIEYEDVEVEGEAENATMTEAVEGETEAAEDTTAEDTAHKTHIERKAKPLNTDDVTLRLWSIEDFDIL